MAASIQGVGKVLCRLSPSILHSVRHYKKLPVRLCLVQSGSLVPPSRPSFCTPPSRSSPCTPLSRSSFCTAASLQEGEAAAALVRYKDRPWDYLESEEYIERYGTNPVWAGYRRNHKGGIPPQKTRKTCIRGDKICGNPCPICRDPNVILHHQNVKLLQQFINPYTEIVYDPTRTGVCMKQQKKLVKAVNTARDHGLLPVQIPHAEFSGEDYSNSHDAVGTTPPPSSLTTWYRWYGSITPDEKEVAKVKKTYKAYLK